MINRFAAAALIGLAVFAASRPALADDAQVMIDNFTFSPATITVALGAQVVWTNRDDIPHTVTDAANPKTIKSAPLDTGDTYARTFDTPGVYAYFCSLHPHMQGAVIVK